VPLWRGLSGGWGVNPWKFHFYKTRMRALGEIRWPPVISPELAVALAQRGQLRWLAANQIRGHPCVPFTAHHRSHLRASTNRHGNKPDRVFLISMGSRSTSSHPNGTELGRNSGDGALSGVCEHAGVEYGTVEPARGAAGQSRFGASHDRRETSPEGLEVCCLCAVWRTPPPPALFM
jgi:hypothetical protein